MNPAVILACLQVAIGVCLVCWAAVLIVRRLREIKWHMPGWIHWQSNDLRVLIDMAARFRDAGNVSAVAACQALIDELLKPKTP